jgi:N-acetylglucosamine kinase-like BadF-type ATPase
MDRTDDHPDQFVVGVDGGGTRTVGVLAGAHGREIRRVETGPTNLHSVGRSAARANLRLLLEALLGDVCLVDQVGASVLGFAGAGRAADAAEMAVAVKDHGLTRGVRVTTDARVALHGAHDGEPGLLLIAGTGSMCYGRDAAGKQSRAGGWGHLLDDVGSAYDVGLSSLRAVVRQADGRTRPSPWGAATLRAVGTGIEGLIDWAGAASKQDIAALAPVTVAAAGDGDASAVGLLERAATDLASLVAAAAPALDLGAKPTVALTGGLLLNDGPYRRLVVAALHRAHPTACARAPIHDAAWGAVLMARALLTETR